MLEVIVSSRAKKEIENAIEYYTLYSNKAPALFIEMLEKAIEILKYNPFHAVRYKNISALSSNDFLTVYTTSQKKTKAESVF